MATEILKKSNIILGLPNERYEEVIKRCGKMLVASGYANERYIEGMIARDKSFSTSIGNAIAIPHGATEYKNEIKSTGMVVLTYPNGVEWNGDKVKLVVGIAAKGDEHMKILEKMALAFEDESAVDQIVASGNIDDFCKLFGITERS